MSSSPYTMPFINGYFVMDNSHYINLHFHIPAYNELQPPPNTIMHLNSAAAQLGLTPKQLTPILQEQHEYLSAN
jgi:hypothetical protein